MDPIRIRTTDGDEIELPEDVSRDVYQFAHATGRSVQEIIHTALVDFFGRDDDDAPPVPR